MRHELTALVAGAILSSSLYAAEPTLHTTPDSGYPFVQENADKALKVAYMIAGKTCQVGTSEGESITTMPHGRQMYSAKLILNAEQQTYSITVMDMLGNSVIDQDMLLFMIYEGEVPIEKTRIGFVKNIQSIQVYDQGVDGHVNSGIEGRTTVLRNYRDFGRDVLGKQHEPYFQDIYLKALDAVIAACEGKQ